jgi:alpha-galactosidase
MRNSCVRTALVWLPVVFLHLFTLPALAQEAKLGSCYARWTEAEITVGNDHIERKWRVEGDLLRAVSFYDRDDHREWLNKPKAAQPTSGKLTVSAQGGTFSPVEAPSLVVDILAGRVLQYRMRIFAAAKGVEILKQPDSTKPASRKEDTPQQPDGLSILEHAAAKSTAAQAPRTADELSLAPQHLRLTQVSFTTVTDLHNQLVSTREWMFMNNEEDLKLHGDLFFVEDVITGSGLIFLKQAALPDERGIQTDYDLQVVSNSKTFRLMGQGYPTVVLAYNGGRYGRIEALQSYQRQLRQYSPGRDGTLLTNTWGDRNRDARINADFIQQEITAGAQLGADVIQIDDGWQAGHSVNSARGPGAPNSFWSGQTPFWAVDAKRFPDGLAPLVSACNTHGMKLGLWYAPDSSQNFANWQRDAEQILDLFHKQGIAYFKFDAINMSSPIAENNLRLLFDRILVGSAGAVTIDLDVTGMGRRPGYFGIMNGGPIFVENRYTDWHRYWPHLTLRNLWQLSEYVDPLRLRMEFLNSARNADLYSNDPLAPGKYSADAIFATVMFSNPLGWFEISNLPKEFNASATPLINTWKKERANLYGGTIMPIGAAPDGVSWTGFASIATAGKPAGGYMLLFRELNEKADWSVEIPLLAESPRHVTVLGGNGSARVEGNELFVHIPEKLQYLWVRLGQD